MVQVKTACYTDGLDVDTTSTLFIKKKKVQAYTVHQLMLHTDASMDFD
jgi:hypothetical protein